jgi:hypothetical protein
MERCRHVAARAAGRYCHHQPLQQLKAYFSQPYLEYHNVAVALAQRKLVLNDIADLSRYSVSSFQRSRQLLGPQFEAMANANPRYREEGDQQVRNLLLYAGRVDVIVGDWRIIQYFNRNCLRSGGQPAGDRLSACFRPPLTRWPSAISGSVIISIVAWKCCASLALPRDRIALRPCALATAPDSMAECWHNAAFSPISPLSRSRMTAKPHAHARPAGLHPRNRHQGQYDFAALIAACPALKPCQTQCPRPAQH